MNPATRTLVQLTTDNIEDVMSLYDVLMGSSSKERKQFIMSHARQYSMANDDDIIYDEGDDE